MADRLLTPREVSERLGVKRSTVYEWAGDGRIEFVKLFDRALRFRESTIDAMVKKFTTKPIRNFRREARTE